jgi:hypothetical protein
MDKSERDSGKRSREERNDGGVFTDAAALGTKLGDIKETIMLPESS